MSRFLSFVVLASAAPAAWALPQPAAVALDPVSALETRLGELTARLLPTTVGLQIGDAGGSGVIVSSDGVVLTAAHVFDRPGQGVTITLHDGTSLQGKTLGREERDDFGLVKLDGDGPFPFAEMGSSATVAVGQPCISLGHPGGVQVGRTAPLRFGSVLRIPARTEDQWIHTDAVVDRGDSGGPLFDLDGRVIGIHSRIGTRTTQNMHIPVDRYRLAWDRLLAGEEIVSLRGVRFPKDRPIFGLSGDGGPNGCRVQRVYPGLPAAEAGVRVRDVIIGVDGTTIDGFDDLAKATSGKKAGDTVQVEIRRRGETLTLPVTLAAAPPAEEGETTSVSGQMPVVDDEEGAAELERLSRASRSIERNLAPLADRHNEAVVQITSGPSRILGTVVGSDGWIVTKDSEISGEPEVVLPGRSEPQKAVVRARHPLYDLAILKLEARDLPAVSLLATPSWRAGQWIVAVGTEDEPIDVGVVSVLPRRQIRGFLGVNLARLPADGGGVPLTVVTPGQAADNANLKAGDVLRAADGEAVADADALRKLLYSRSPGERVRFTVVRGDDTFDAEVVLGTPPEAGSPAPAPTPRGRGRGRRDTNSRRAEGFQWVVQHDAVLTAAECGGPLLNRSGECIGINIARAARYCTYAVPSDTVLALLEEAQKQ